MRLIDADQMALDESEAYMSAQGQIADDLTWLVNFGAHNKIQRIIADTPTVDAVPVVRCRDCKYYDPEDWDGCTCHAYGGMTDPADYSFCSQGERRKYNADR